MRHGLHLHPDSICLAASHIEVDLERPEPGRLRLRYRVSGDIPRLRLPPVTASARADDLWRTTCFEVFIRPGDSPAYYEFNFAPSTQWAAYRFDGYRRGMAPAEGVAPPRIGLRRTADGFELEVALALDRTCGLPPDGALRLGLSAVIEAPDGSVSLWALAHPSGKADFHHADSFALDLPGMQPS
jgi:hypothetical protein